MATKRWKWWNGFRKTNDLCCDWLLPKLPVQIPCLSFSVNFKDEVIFVVMATLYLNRQVMVRSSIVWSFWREKSWLLSDDVEVVAYTSLLVRLKFIRKQIFKQFFVCFNHKLEQIQEGLFQESITVQLYIDFSGRPNTIKQIVWSAAMSTNIIIFFA